MSDPGRFEADRKEVERLKDRMLKRSFFVMVRKIIDARRLPELLLAHYQWIIALEKTGAVFASGPLFKRDDDGPGVGMTVFRAADYSEAEKLASGDPFCSGGAATYELQRWQINEGRLSIAIDFSDQSCRFE